MPLNLILNLRRLTTFFKQRWTHSTSELALHPPYGRFPVEIPLLHSPRRAVLTPMTFAILRVAKLKTMGNVGGHGNHVERQRQTPNADQQRIDLNQRLAGTHDVRADVEARFKAAGITPQKNAVVAIDVFISASPEHFQHNHPEDPNWKAFQAKALEFLRQEYGAENVVHAMAHHDETSPHLHAIITPIKTKTVKVGRKVKTERTENRLCARDWLGGDRTTLSKLQTRFADSVKELGLSRGVPGSRADHTEVKQFYTVMKETTDQAKAINLALTPIDADYFVKAVPKPGLLDLATPRQFAQTQVSNALSSLRQQIEQTNQNAQTARNGQLVKLQRPATVALLEKARSRKSRAEAALTKLGYRLDEHGQLVNLRDDRKNALRATISKSLSICTSSSELIADLALKGVKIGFSKDLPEVYEGKTYYGAVLHDGKGRITATDLGPDYTTVNLAKQLAITAQKKEQERTRQEQERKAAEEKEKTEMKKPKISPTASSPSSKIEPIEKPKKRRGPKLA